MDRGTFEDRRRRFAEAIGDGIAVIPAAAETIRNHDVEYPFRQDSDFYYLTGFDEPDAVAVINPGHDRERFVLFVRPRDRESETWTGRRAGVVGAVADFGADAAYPISELDERLRGYLLDRPVLFYRMGNPIHDGRITSMLARAGRYRSRDGRPTPGSVADPAPLLAELRLRKTPAEIDLLRRACDISAGAHIEAMRFARPGLYEYQVQAALEYVFRVQGSPRVAYGSIVASGPNACVLHYTRNDRRLEAGDLLLIDAGAEYGYHSADITRTFPADGKFTGAQRDLYEVVLTAQRAAIGAAEPGGSMKQLHETARRELTAGLVELGLLPRNLEDSLAMHHDREFYMHGTGHWLGMDVHDAGDYMTPDRQGRAFEPGMVFTVEPGLYIDPAVETVSFPLLEYDEAVWRERRYRLGQEAARKLEAEEKEKAGSVEHPIPPALIGLGVRIEDDILIVPDGHENLTGAAPSSIEDVEATCLEAPRLPVF